MGRNEGKKGESREEKVIAILTLALLPSNVNWGHLIIGTDLETLVHAIALGYLYTAFMLIVSKGIELST